MSITTQTETILTTLPLPTVASVPPENFRFVPGSAMVTNSTINPRITNGTHKSPFFNGTGYYIEEETEQGLSELQTLLLACIATFIPLIISVLAIFGVRMLWRKYKKYKNCNNYDGDVLHERDNSEPLSKPLSSHLFNSDQIKCSETHLSITGEDMEICDGTATGASEPQTTHSTSHSSTNGSIITMTLKNNHLIVETEERSDLEEDSRETTMKYSPGARDGVFVVEVQQGSRRSPGSESNKEPSKSTSNQCALVHNPPDRYNAEKRSEEAGELGKKKFTPEKLKSNLLNLQLKTGLTQSNSSLTSSSQVYRYGNQVGYDSGFYGYSTYNDSIFDEPIPKPEVATSKPKIISELFKNRSDSKCSPDEYLMSDSALMNRGPSEMDDPIQQEQNRLGNSIYAEKSVEKSKKDLWQRNDSKKFENLYAVH